MDASTAWAQSNKTGKSLTCPNMTLDKDVTVLWFGQHL